MRKPSKRNAGYSLLELIFALGLGVTVSAAAVPQYLAAANDVRAAAAARYVVSRLQRSRMEAISRSRQVALVFGSDAQGYFFTPYVDGDGDGVLLRDIQRGIDVALGPVERLSDRFAGVDFGAIPGLPAVDVGATAPGTDPIRLGSGNSASFAPNGSSTTGTVYIRGRGDVQYAVRLYGDTGKTRLLKFERGAGQWKTR